MATPYASAKRASRRSSAELRPPRTPDLDTGFFEGPGADIYTAWLDEHLGKTLADQGALGLAGMVKVYADRKAAETRETPETR